MFFVFCCFFLLLISQNTVCGEICEEGALFIGFTVRCFVTVFVQRVVLLSFEKSLSLKHLC